MIVITSRIRDDRENVLSHFHFESFEFRYFDLMFWLDVCSVFPDEKGGDVISIISASVESTDHWNF